MAITIIYLFIHPWTQGWKNYYSLDFIFVYYHLCSFISLLSCTEENTLSVNLIPRLWMKATRRIYISKEEKLFHRVCTYTFVCAYLKIKSERVEIFHDFLLAFHYEFCVDFLEF